MEAPQGRSEALRVLRDAIRLYDRERDRLRGADAAAPPRTASDARPAAGASPGRKAARRRR